METFNNVLRLRGEDADVEKKEPTAQEMDYAKEEHSRRVDYISALSDGVFQMLRDIDGMELELDRARLILKKTQAQLAQSSRLKALGELAAGLAHEINQPLTVIRGLSQHLLNLSMPEDPDFKKLKLLAEAAKRMEAIISHLRVFSRGDGDAPRMEPVDINRVIDSAFVMLGGILANGSVKTVMNLSDVPPIRGCPARLEQVVVNLVTNARDAMPKGGEIKVATKTFERDGVRFVRMSVSDTGCGITEEIRNRIFDPFFTSKRPGEGTGLGLSISSAIITEHNGDISCESTPGKGATFHVTLPAIS